MFIEGETSDRNFLTNTAFEKKYSAQHVQQARLVKKIK